MQVKTHKVVPWAEVKPEDTASGDRLWFGAVSLLLLTLFIYIPSYKAGFIWDDDVIAGNPLLKEGWNGLRDIWFSIRFGDFCPITATSFWLEWQIHGAMKEIQHATNIVLQALNVVLLWRVLRQLRVPEAWLVAAIFAVHPVCVASVTWLAERKNTLSMFFYLQSLLFYLRSEVEVKPTPVFRFQARSYWLSFVFFLLALLSKSSVVVLPVVLLLCVWWRHGTIDRLRLMRLAPFFGFAFAVGVITLVAHFYYGPKLGVLPTGDTAWVRVLTAGRAVCFYLSKDLLPVGLTLHYPRWPISATSPLAYLPGLAIVGMLLLFWRFRQSWGRACLFGFVYFLVALAPTVGAVNMAFLMMAQVADHFQFLALPGIIALLVGGGIWTLQRWFPQPVVASLLFVALGAPLAFLSWEHQRVMAHPETLWRDNLQKNPESWAAYNNLGGIAFERGQLHDAERMYREAVKRRDNLSMVHVNLGRTLFAEGKTHEAIEQYAVALRLDETDFKAQNNLGVALISLGQTNAAIACFQKAVEIVPGDATFFSNLARLLVQTGKVPEALQLFDQHLKRVPTDAIAHSQMAELFFNTGKLDDAHIHYEEAVRLMPEFLEARFGLGEILARKNRKAEAIQQWREILKRKSDAVQVLANIAWALATDRDDKIRDGSEAVLLAERVCEIVGRENPVFLDLLAAAYAEAGRFEDALKTEANAQVLASAQGERNLATVYEQRIKLYRAGKPFRAS